MSELDFEQDGMPSHRQLENFIEADDYDIDDEDAQELIELLEIEAFDEDPEDLDVVDTDDLN